MGTERRRETMQTMKRSEKERRKLAEKQLKQTTYELGRYKKKVQDQQKEIERLREEAVGYQQSIDMSFAMVTAAVMQAGGLTITQEELVHLIREERLAAVSYDAERMAYTLRVEVSEDGGEES